MPVFVSLQQLTRRGLWSKSLHWKDNHRVIKRDQELHPPRCKELPEAILRLTRSIESIYLHLLEHVDIFCNDWENMDVDFKPFCSLSTDDLKIRRTTGQALATGLSTCPTLSWTSMIHVHNNCDKNQKRKLNESGRWICLLRFFGGFVDQFCFQGTSSQLCSGWSTSPRWLDMVCQVYELRNVECDDVWKKEAKKRARSQRWGKVGTGWKLLSMFSGNSKRHILMSASQVFCWVEY